MISFSGYSSTTTSTTKKKDAVEKITFATIDQVAVIVTTQSTSVENLVVHRTSGNLYNENKEIIAAGNIPQMQTIKVASNPPPDYFKLE